MRIALCLALLATAAVAANNPIDDAALGNDADGRNWAAAGRTYSDSHDSPLAEINRDTVARLNLAWTLDLDATGVASPPLAIEGVLYVMAGPSVVHAVDARTGKLLWRYAPEMSQIASAAPRPGGGGVAFWKGRVYATTADARLVALDAKKGAVVWNVPVVDSPADARLPGAPRVVGGKVLAAAGDVAAFDANTGEPQWRWRPPEAGSAATLAVDASLARVYVSSARGIVALDLNRGTEVWRHESAGAASTLPGQRPDDPPPGLSLVSLPMNGAARALILRPSASGIDVIDCVDGKSLSIGKPGLAAGIASPAFSPKTGILYVPARDPAADVGKSFLLAWDPAKQRANWQQPTPGAWSGGTLATAGDLVFQGQIDGYLMAYDAGTGKRAWQFYAATAALGTPITYLAGGRQQLSIVVGAPEFAADAAGAARFGWDARVHPRRLLTFVLDGKAKLPATPPPSFVKPPAAPVDPKPEKKEEVRDTLPPGSLESTTPRS